ncbi:MAG: glucose 1-dehydrogenase [Thermomicrobiales bacterium]|nr:glucose 1-dehydrogenase [Thermomicrobiales bacterium]
MTDRFRLDGRVALVNGASRGIGRAIALGLAEAGATVALAARSEAHLHEVAREIGGDTFVIPADLRDPDQAREMVAGTIERFGQVDILVNAAGAALRAPAETTHEADIAEIFASNFNGIAVACAAAGRHFIERRSGRIINIASLASFRGVPGRALYGATKGAIAQLTRTLAVEWGAHNVGVNAIAPGWIATDFTREVLAQPEVRERVLDRTPLKRIGDPDDIVGLAVFLASPAAAFITGQVICCDGGYSAG